MRLYSARIEDFYDHVRDNTLADTIRDNFKAHLGRYPGIPEYNSFNPNSAGIPRAAGVGPSAMRARPDGVYASRRAPAMRAENFSRSFQAKSSGQYVKNLAEKAALKDVHISFEYEVPYNTSRIDCLLFGRSAAAKAYVFRHPLFAPKYNKLIAEFPVYTMTEVAGLAGKLNPNSEGIPREAGGGPSAMRARPDGVRPGFRARHNYASRPGRKAGGDFSSKIAEAGSRKTAMRFMRDYASRRDSTGPFAMPWETHDKVKPPEGYVKWFEWAFKPEGIKQVGCIYTAQGFEFDYIGVIIGKDFFYDPLLKKMTGNLIASFDRTLRQNAANFTEYARNIYRVLLSRGMKGCYVDYLPVFSLQAGCSVFYPDRRLSGSSAMLFA